MSGKKVLLVAKSGGVFYTREEARQASAVGEQGETEGIIRRLCSRGDCRVIYFGHYRGEILPGLEVFRPHKVRDEWASTEEQLEGFRADERDMETLLGGDSVAGMINVAGYAATTSTLNNPSASQPQLCAMLYVAPMLNILRHLNVPRVVINNDPRSYPREGEMSWGWDACRPVALLDQCDREFRQRIMGRYYMRRSVWARAESWAAQLRVEDTPKIRDSVVVAHAHVADGCRQRGRSTAWDSIVTEDFPYEVYGKGWDLLGRPVPQWQGFVRPDRALELFAESKTTFAVAATPGFYTGKVYVAVGQDCVPILWGTGEDPYTWDPKGLLAPLDSDVRVREGHDEDWRRALDFNLRHYDENLVTWKQNCVPHWELFDQCVSGVLNGDDVNSDSWYEKFGGYRRTV